MTCKVTHSDTRLQFSLLIKATLTPIPKSNLNYDWGSAGPVWKYCRELKKECILRYRCTRSVNRFDDVWIPLCQAYNFRYMSWRHDLVRLKTDTDGLKNRLEDASRVLRKFNVLFSDSVMSRPCCVVLCISLIMLKYVLMWTVVSAIYSLRVNIDVCNDCL